MTETDAFRLPTEHELAVIRKLLSATFPGVQELREQTSRLLVRELDDDGCLELRVENKRPADVLARVPVEASYSDTNNPDLFAPRVHILLHIKHGLMHELEVYKDDNSELLRQPTAEELVVETYPYV